MRYKVETMRTASLEAELNGRAVEGWELKQILGTGTDQTKVVMQNPSLPPIDEVKDDKTKGEDNAQ
jgi:hypothetical protein